MITDKIVLENLTETSVIIHVSYSNVVWHQHMASPIPDTYDLFINNTTNRELLAKKLNKETYDELISVWGENPTINTPDVDKINVDNLIESVQNLTTAVNSNLVAINNLTQNKLNFINSDYIYATSTQNGNLVETDPISTATFNSDTIYKIKIAANAIGNNTEQYGYITQSEKYIVDNSEKVTQLLITATGEFYTRTEVYDETGVTKFPVFTKEFPTITEFNNLKEKVDNFEALLTDLNTELDNIINELRN